MKTIMSIIGGVVLGCLVMYISHNDIYHHYNTCQEQELLRKLAEINDDKNWYIKENAKGEIKIIELSKRELDSLNKLK